MSSQAHRPKMKQRIVSLVPSATEILYFLGLEARLVGVTEHCNYPEEAKIKCKVGRFAQPKLAKILYLEPDLVLADWALHRTVIEELEKQKIDVLSATPVSVEDVFTLMASLAELSQTADIQPRLDTLKRKAERLAQNPILRRPRVFRLMSTNPFITPGPGSFQYDALRLTGAQLPDFQNGDAYIRMPWQQLLEFDPEVILFCGVEPGQPLPPRCQGCLAKQPICQRTAGDFITAEWQQISAVRENRLYPLSCDTICRPGPRLIEGMEKLQKLWRSLCSENFS